MVLYYTSMSEYTDNKGKVDWAGYRKAQINNGEYCRQCDGLIPIPTGYSTKCQSCVEFEKSKEEVYHHSVIRCPKCTTLFTDKDYDLLEESFVTYCPTCDYEFRVRIITDVSLISPPLLKESNEKESD